MIISELFTKSLASDAADDQSLPGIAEEFLRPVYGAAIHKFQLSTGSI